MTRRAIAFALATVIAAGAAGGCGGGSGSGGSGGAEGSEGGGASAQAAANVPEVSGSSISKEEFVKRANALCVKEGDRFIEEAAGFGERYEAQGKPPAGELAHLVDEVFLPKVEREIKKIAAMGAPSGDEEAVAAVLAAKQEGIEKARALRDPKSLAQVDTQFADARTLAKEYGIGNCG